MPFPTAETPPQSNGGGGGAFEVQHYTVQEGDTLTKIASQFGVTVDELMQANSFSNSTIYVGQNIVIPIGSLTVGQKIEGQRGIFSTTIFKQTDGSQRTQYNFITNTVASGAMLLIGDNLQDLQKDNGLPIVIWGTIDQINQQGIPVIKVDRYEIPFPDLKYKILKGTESSANVQGQAALLFNNAEDGKTYVQLSTNCSDLVMQAALLNPGLTDSQILLEALAVPDLTFGGYPTLCTNNKAMAINPKNGKPMEMTITADQPYIVDESTSAGPGLLPTATIEKVELIYYVADPRYAVTDPAAGQPYIQPMWRFTGHYSTGDEFEILVQALKDEFLSPEIQTIQGPG
ncbi:MAG: LysM peptidoglycan-binding domain-containing protein [Anaerolineales bacterium]|nr:LysM peptidoglycan-binding domain-containing protein [Anaerolineales bacterium]